MNSTIKTLVLASALAAATFSLRAANFAEGLFPDPVIAKGKGVEVKRSQLEDAFTGYRANLAARGQTIPEDKRATTEAQLLDRMIVTQLLAARATEADKAKARETGLKFIDTSRQSAPSEEFFLRQLKSLSMTPAQFTNRVVEQAMAEEVVNREIKSKVVISDAQIKKYYDDNPINQPELARASHILLTTKDLKTQLEMSDEHKKAQLEKAKKILARVNKGEDFTKLVQEVSEDPGVKENKGEYKFARAKDDPRNAMVPPFETAAFSMKTNQISDIVTTDFGYHIIKLHEITPPKKVELAEVSPRIKEVLTQQEMEKSMPDFFEKIKKEGEVKILDEKLAAIPLPKPEARPVPPAPK